MRACTIPASGFAALLCGKALPFRQLRSFFFFPTLCKAQPCRVLGGDETSVGGKPEAFRTAKRQSRSGSRTLHE